MKNSKLNKILFYGFVMLGMVILILSGIHELIPRLCFE